VDHAKDLFLSVLGHDLRTPLGAVMMGAMLLLTEERSDWAHARTAQRILTSGERMDEIIRDLLDFTRGRLGSGIPLDRADTDLEELLRSSIDELTTAHTRCQIALTPGPVHGDWDRARLEQVTANLIGNACQHGAQGEPVEVRLTTDRDTAVVAIHNKAR
jgi:signal transduction histidine kinase